MLPIDSHDASTVLRFARTILSVLKAEEEERCERPDTLTAAGALPPQGLGQGSHTGTSSAAEALARRNAPVPCGGALSPGFDLHGLHDLPAAFQAGVRSLREHVLHGAGVQDVQRLVRAMEEHKK